MKHTKLKPALVILVGSLISSIYVSVPMTFLMLILGLLVVPPLLVLITIVKEGIRINKKMNGFAGSSTEKPLIIISKEA